KKMKNAGAGVPNNNPPPTPGGGGKNAPPPKLLFVCFYPLFIPPPHVARPGRAGEADAVGRRPRARQRRPETRTTPPRRERGTRRLKEACPSARRFASSATQRRPRRRAARPSTICTSTTERSG